MGAFVALQNAEALQRRQVPSLPPAMFRAELLARVRDGARVAALFGLPGAPLEVWALLAGPEKRRLRLGRTVPEDGRLRSLATELPELQLFERELAEQLGVIPEEHPWPKPVRFERKREGAVGEPGEPPAIGEVDWYRVGGEEIHEVAVGPVHAGVIEPGHFRFQCHGEEVLHLEISLGYQHRGVERALLGGPGKRTLHYLETLAGDSSVAHAVAGCQALEALAGAAVPPGAEALRGVALELERLANHTGTLGALAGDVGYLPTASFCGRLRGEFLNLTAELCGSRFGRGMVVPGGVGFPVEEQRAARILERASAAMEDLRASVALLWSTPSVVARFEETGRVEQETARRLGLVGVAARASGLSRDTRADFPAGSYRHEPFPIATLESGDVLARARVRALEAEHSFAFVRDRLAALPEGGGRATFGPLAPDQVAASLVEGHRGELCHVAITGPDGRFAAYKIVDPSFHNWMGLALSLRGQQISDFPLCNKSFDLSYCGFDL